ncbi:MAG: trypsin-like peptidase domain-containing protein [Lentisphaeria bacterium]|nr:trypsin-like peptidase domain-containing protein [Lentisphaeria bacterium]
MTIRRTTLSHWPTLFLALALVCMGVRAEGKDPITSSVIRIQATAQQPDYRVPWNPGASGAGRGTGFAIGGKRIMTNAHVVSNARFISVQKPTAPEIFSARVLFIAHDCDLAILAVDDEAFFKGLPPLVFGTVPALHSTVMTYGFPIGGSQLSVTRGVVSRIEFRPYAHSALDAHLAIQTDAAINPGNSGGPVIQDGKVVGVAFQGLSGAVAQNTGYMIPTPVVERFLTDIKDGRYDGYCELGTDTFNLRNKAARERLALPDNGKGVVITSVLEVACAHGLLKRGDVLLKIDGHEILSDGQIKLDGKLVQLVEIVERKHRGETVSFDILRSGKAEKIKVKLDGCWPYQMRAHRYDKTPRYLVFAGLVFQPLHLDFIRAYGVKSPDILDVFNFYISDALYNDQPQPVVLASILSDPTNTHYDMFRMSMVDTVNDVKIRTLKQLDEVLSKQAEQYVFHLVGHGMPLVIEAEGLEAVNARVASQYALPSLKNLGEDEEVSK